MANGYYNGAFEFWLLEFDNVGQRIIQFLLLSHPLCLATLLTGEVHPK